MHLAAESSAYCVRTQRVVMELAGRNGCPINARISGGTKCLGFQAIHILCGSSDKRFNMAPVVHSLLKNHAEVDARTLLGQTPLMRAASSGQAGVVSLLLGWNADVHAVNTKGRTALEQCSGSSSNCRQILQDYMRTLDQAPRRWSRPQETPRADERPQNGYMGTTLPKRLKEGTFGRYAARPGRR